MTRTKELRKAIWEHWTTHAYFPTAIRMTQAFCDTLRSEARVECLPDPSIAKFGDIPIELDETVDSYVLVPYVPPSAGANIRVEHGVAVCGYCGFALITNLPRDCCAHGRAYDAASTYARETHGPRSLPTT